jgi:hypothetical protein
MRPIIHRNSISCNESTRGYFKTNLLPAPIVCVLCLAVEVCIYNEVCVDKGWPEPYSHDRHTVVRVSTYGSMCVYRGRHTVVCVCLLTVVCV